MGGEGAMTLANRVLELADESHVPGPSGGCPICGFFAEAAPVLARAVVAGGSVGSEPEETK